MYREKVWYLKNIMPLFMGLPAEDYQALDTMLSHFHCSARAPVYVSGEGEDGVYFLKEGRVRLAQVTSEGKEITLDYLEPGAVFGSLVGDVGDENGVFAEAVADAYLCKVSRDAFEGFIAARPALMLGITKLLGFRLRKIQVRLQTLLFHDVKARILLVLGDLAHTYGEDVAGGTRLRIKLTHQDVANLIGATRESTSQAISELRAEGALDFEKKYPILKQLSQKATT